MRAASSRDGSIDRSAAEMIRYASGARINPSTKIIPGMEYTLNGGSPTRRATTLISPIRGLSSSTHAVAVSSGGSTFGTTATSSKSARPGASVRTVIQASRPATTSEIAAAPAAKTKEFPIIRYVLGSPYAAR